MNHSFYLFNYLYIFLFIYSVLNFECNHDYPKDHEVITGVRLDGPHRIHKRDTSQSLKIKLYFDDSVQRLPEKKYKMIKERVLPEAVSFWQRALMVRKSENVIRLDRRCLDSQVFFLSDELRPYCKEACENQTMCGEVTVPEDHLYECRVCDGDGSNCRVEGAARGPGVPGAHFVLYISAVETDRCLNGFTVAYAAHCHLEAVLDRPISGHANLCPSSISLKEQDVQTLLSTVKHEILHALGFSISLYAYFRDDDGNPLTERTENGKPPMNEELQARQWSDRVMKSVERPEWHVRNGTTTKRVSVVVTPRVAAEVRKHFGCETLEGAELEDQGLKGTAFSHWEKRLFENEAMTGTHTQNPVYSRLTFALMEDTGWYFANYSLARPLDWGSNLGCDFATRSCKHWMDSRRSQGLSIHPFCDKVKSDPLQTECADDRKSVALCNLIGYLEPLPSQFQNFDSIPSVNASEIDLYGGSVALADYCPYIQEFTWKNQDVVIRGSHCQFPENNPEPDRNFALENYTSGSYCFNHLLEWSERNCRQIRHWQHWGSGCYVYDCSGGRVNVRVANHTFTCYSAGQSLPISIFGGTWLHEGGLICPPCAEMCGDACLPDTETPADVQYHSDDLKCGGTALTQGLSILFVCCFHLIIVFTHR